MHSRTQKMLQFEVHGNRSKTLHKTASPRLCRCQPSTLCRNFTLLSVEYTNKAFLEFNLLHRLHQSGLLLNNQFLINSLYIALVLESYNAVLFCSTRFLTKLVKSRFLFSKYCFRKQVLFWKIALKDAVFQVYNLLSNAQLKKHLQIWDMLFQIHFFLR